MQTVVNDVEIRGVYKQIGKNVILNGIDLQVKQGELLTLLGPSGCGKTSTLNVIAGFLDIDKGEVFIKGKKVTHIPPYKRGLGMVFQTYSLFPHMTVYENLDFGLSLRKVPKEERKKRIEQALELVKMVGLENRYPRQLSGGQRQRVAIARALVVQPMLLLLDEPLSNLDAKLRYELRAEIKRLQKEVGVTTIFVTHDQEEALSLSDRIVVMNKGIIEQVGTPTEIYEHPCTEFVFQFVGKSNQLEGKVKTVDSRMVCIELEEGVQVLVESKNMMGPERSYSIGDEVKLYIRPEKLTIQEQESEPEIFYYNKYNASIVQMNYLGSAWEIELLLFGKRVQVLQPFVKSDWKIGAEVTVGWNPSDMMIVKK
ncbi:ABC transporter ATP-binding protein [Geobacillus sp. TFV-3]|uniref:ABC transporter ATP-binding protein n=1 Tax=Geobacillus sp. TFV-3 TaxID=1897059 RepID=UPI00135AD496|nr:ABC transporter ATP-binding protein [Geobacillus sp. TFV-3]KAF0995322.1 Sulfate/thiosulfate import ATP-binding protein CysA [Geobacillus sp. TFV-3]